MSRAGGILFFLLLSLFGLTTVVNAARVPAIPHVPGGIPGIPKIPKIPKAKVYPARLHVAGGLTFTSSVNTLASCSPGQAWTMVESMDLVINDRVTVRVVDKKVSSNPARGGHRSVRQVSRIRDYRTTNNCPPDAPVKLTKPPCRSVGGTGAAWLIPDPRPGGRASMAFGRLDGPIQTCSGPEVDPLQHPRGTVLTLLQAPHIPLTLPLGLKATRFKNLKVGSKHSLVSTVKIRGRCASATAVAHPASSRAAAADDCKIEGLFNVLVKRLPKKHRRK